MFVTHIIQLGRSRGFMKSNVCFSKGTGKPLTVYTSEAEVDASALYEHTMRGSELYPYLCDKCGYYHCVRQLI